jgi:hypothetical protein
MGELALAHPSLLDRTVFRHIFYQKFSPNQIQAYISLNTTKIYIDMTITEVHTPIFI